VIEEYLKKEVDSFIHTGVGYIEFFHIINNNLRPNSYFEIGTSGGTSLKAFPCDALCIDPQFTIEASPLDARRRSFFLQMTSDEFFRTQSVRNFFPDGPDICFLDGMHRFEFLLRDFINAEAACHRNSIIFLHDCLPVNERMAERTTRFDEAEDVSTAYGWTGDVWRMLPALKKYRPDLRIILLDCGPTGLIAVTNLDPDSRTLKEKYNRIVDETMSLSLATLGFKQLWSMFPMIDTRRLASRPYDITAVFNVA
jgi:hypothetical protein